MPMKLRSVMLKGLAMKGAAASAAAASAPTTSFGETLIPLRHASEGARSRHRRDRTAPSFLGFLLFLVAERQRAPQEDGDEEAEHDHLLQGAAVEGGEAFQERDEHRAER